MSRITWVVLPTVACLVLLAGCAGQAGTPSSKTPVGSAKLDAENTQIVYPIDTYGMTWRDVQKVDYASEVLTNECMEKQGNANPKLSYEKPSYKPFPDWTFGYWNADFTARYGLGESFIPSNPGAKQLDSSEKMLSEYDACLKKNELPVLDHLRLTGDGPPSAVFEAFHASVNQALSDPRGQKLRSEWVSCIRKEGVEPSDKTQLALKLDPSWSSEELYKAVTVSATCADQLKVVQGLANLAAGFQAQYIHQHEAQFVEIQKQRDKILKKADQIIAAHGG